MDVVEDKRVSLSSRAWKVRESVSGGRKKGGFRLERAVTYRDNEERCENKIETLPQKKEEQRPCCGKGVTGVRCDGLS